MKHLKMKHLNKMEKFFSIQVPTVVSQTEKKTFTDITKRLMKTPCSMELEKVSGFTAKEL